MTNATPGTCARPLWFHVLGVRVDTVQIPDVVAMIEDWASHSTRTRYIAVTGMHGVTEAQSDPEFKRILNSADLVVADGMPLVLMGRWRGFCCLKRRVYGPELMLQVCENTAGKPIRHFLYGGGPGVADELATVLRGRFQGLEIAGTLCPPFRPLTATEEEETVHVIERSGAHIVWVGLSTPKQERWMHSFRDRLRVPVLIGVGAAFDLNAGLVPQAPRWLGDHGLEWLYRLWREPRRLWRRYLIGGSKFCFYIALELFGIKKFDPPPAPPQPWE